MIVQLRIFPALQKLLESNTAAVINLLMAELLVACYFVCALLCCSRAPGSSVPPSCPGHPAACLVSPLAAAFAGFFLPSRSLFDRWQAASSSFGGSAAAPQASAAHTSALALLDLLTTTILSVDFQGETSASSLGSCVLFLALRAGFVDRVRVARFALAASSRCISIAGLLHACTLSVPRQAPPRRRARRAARA